MPLITPPTYPDNIGLDLARTADERVVARIAGPVATGMTLFRRSGVWHLKAAPSSADLAESDIVFLGGHMYDISTEIYDEIVAAGFFPHGIDDDELRLLEDGIHVRSLEDGTLREMEVLT